MKYDEFIHDRAGTHTTPSSSARAFWMDAGDQRDFSVYRYGRNRRLKIIPTPSH